MHYYFIVLYLNPFNLPNCDYFLRFKGIVIFYALLSEQYSVQSLCKFGLGIHIRKEQMVSKHLYDLQFHLSRTGRIEIYHTCNVSHHPTVHR